MSCVSRIPYIHISLLLLSLCFFVFSFSCVLNYSMAFLLESFCQFAFAGCNIQNVLFNTETIFVLEVVGYILNIYLCVCMRCASIFHFFSASFSFSLCAFLIFVFFFLLSPKSVFCCWFYCVFLSLSRSVSLSLFSCVDSFEICYVKNQIANAGGSARKHTLTRRRIRTGHLHPMFS